MISTVGKVLFLKNIELFSQIPGEDLAQIARITDELSLEDGEVVFQQGDPGDTLFFVVSGTVKVTRGQAVVATLGPKDVFGEMALLDSEPRSATITAAEDVQLLRIQRDDFHDILTEKAELALGIIKVLSRRLRATTARQYDAP